MRRLCRQMGVCVFLLISLSLGTVVLVLGMGHPTEESGRVPDAVFLMNYDVNRLSDRPADREIKLGYEIFRNTTRHLGPDQPDAARRFAGNRLACANCHLDAGTRPYAAPLIGVVERFPQYRGREDKIGTIEERINGCMERSMNGHMMPEDSQEMKAMIAYLKWLGRYAPEDGAVTGKGFAGLEIPDRAVDPDHGERVFRRHCTACHGSDGQGRLSDLGAGYLYPPLWGADSYNNGAGMTRVITAASFIKSNMPYGTRYDRPVLTDEEAFDVAGYINLQGRPEKPNREADFPDLTRKPVSTPYGPYADTFPAEQHQLGPFQPIMAYYLKTYNLNKSK